MKYILPYVTFIFFMLNSCSVSLQDNSQELMQVQIQTHESNAQLFTIFPAHPHTLTYRFTQFQSNKQKMSTTIDNLPAVVFAYAGTSDVKLDAIDATTGKVVLSATQKNIVIDGTAALQFELKPLSEGDGDVEITLRLPENHGVTKVEAKINDDLQNTNVLFSGNTITFKKQKLPTTNYVVSLKLFLANNTVATTITEFVVIRPNLTSRKVIVLDKLFKEVDVLANFSFDNEGKQLLANEESLVKATLAATNEETPAFSHGVATKNALYFPQGDSHIYYTISGLADYADLTSWSISFWVKPNCVNEGNYTILSDGDGKNTIYLKKDSSSDLKIGIIYDLGGA